MSHTHPPTNDSQLPTTKSEPSAEVSSSSLMPKPTSKKKIDAATARPGLINALVATVAASAWFWLPEAVSLAATAVVANPTDWIVAIASAVAAGVVIVQAIIMRWQLRSMDRTLAELKRQNDHANLSLEMAYRAWLHIEPGSVELMRNESDPDKFGTRLHLRLANAGGGTASRVYARWGFTPSLPAPIDCDQYGEVFIPAGVNGIALIARVQPRLGVDASQAMMNFAEKLNDIVAGKVVRYWIIVAYQDMFSGAPEGIRGSEQSYRHTFYSGAFKLMRSDQTIIIASD